ncbi:MAG: hypothetical protein ACREPL_14595 [Rhodanobacteraceae bacterium]
MADMLALASRAHFDHRRSKDFEDDDAAIALVVAAIADPTPTQMLCRLLDGYAHAPTELATVAGCVRTS